ncbi:hypothetical protein ACFWBB_35200 [Streptomyces sp. NPDC060000]|uniref:hypothetical protein n=1 Tax=Streptomyces sp. NPDC060000 TaxID=3347031 RepID=UPI0036B06FF0
MTAENIVGLAEACTAPCAISRATASADAAWRQSLGSVTVADLAADVESAHGNGALAGIGAWLSPAGPSGGVGWTVDRRRG